MDKNKMYVGDQVWIYEIGRRPEPAIITDMNPLNMPGIIRCHKTDTNIAPDKVHALNEIFKRPSEAKKLLYKIKQDSYDCAYIAEKFEEKYLK